MQERYDSLTNSVKESTVVEPSVVAPATGRKVSIPDVFNSPSPQSTPTSSPSHKASPTNGTTERSRQQSGNERLRESPVPSPRSRRMLSDGSPSPSPKTARRVKLRSVGVSGESETRPQTPPTVGGGQHVVGNGDVNI